MHFGKPQFKLQLSESKLVMIVKKGSMFISRVKWFNNYKKGLYFLLNLNNKLKDKKVKRVDFKIFTKQYP